MAASLHWTNVCGKEVNTFEGVDNHIILGVLQILVPTHSKVRVRALLREMVQSAHRHQPTQVKVWTLLQQVLDQVTHCLGNTAQLVYMVAHS